MDKNFKIIKRIQKGESGLKLSSDSKEYSPTIDDLVNFTASYETYKATPYNRNTSAGNPQTLAGYGSADPYIIGLARNGKLTEEIAKTELKKHLQKTYDELNSRIPNFKNLSSNIQLALVDTAYNIGINKLIDKSPSLMGMINSGITDPEQLVTQMDHSKSAGGWLGVRSAARRAMALGKYDWNYPSVDKYGRHVDYNQYKGPEDYKSSPYIMFKNGGIIKRVDSGKSGIKIKPENKGKFTETKKRTGKTTEELTHSKNPLTRKRAIFAQNAKKWNH